MAEYEKLQEYAREEAAKKPKIEVAGANVQTSSATWRAEGTADNSHSGLTNGDNFKDEKCPCGHFILMASNKDQRSICSACPVWSQYGAGRVACNFVGCAAHQYLFDQIELL